MHADVHETHYLFQGLSPEQITQLAPLFEPLDYLADTMLFEQGDPAEYLYAIVSGEVVVHFKPDDGTAITVARVQPGSIVGWSAALGSRRYTSGATCTTPTHLLRVRGDDLRGLCLQYPETGVLVLDRLATVIAERLHSTYDLVRNLLQMGLNNQESHGTGG